MHNPSSQASDHRLLTIHSLVVRTVNVPLVPPVTTAAGVIASAPLVLLDLQTREGVTGHAYVFTYTTAALGPTATLVKNLEPIVANQALAPATLSRQLGARFKLLGNQGLVAIALALIDMAAWDAFARALDLPLARLLGATGTEQIPSYASLRGWTADELAGEAGRAVAAGFKAVKLKIGHPTLRREREVFTAVREVVGDEVQIMLDPNQAFTVPEATRRATAYAGWGAAWLEEPVRADDLVGHALLARTCNLPIQRGENDWGPDGIARSIGAGASQLIMPDVMKVGGVTGWMAAAALADAAGIPVSSHIFVEFSSHLMAATPGRHWLEWLDVAGPIRAEERPLLLDGAVAPSISAGAGLTWNEDAIRQYSRD